MEDEPEKLTEEEKKNVKIYHIYMDKTIKYSEGRKINIELCVENPRAKDIYRVCEEILGLKCKLEAKSHPKDWQKRGRVLVQIKDKEGKVIQDSLKTSK
jgi:signal recognition particle subunit SRP19